MSHSPPTRSPNATLPPAECHTREGWTLLQTAVSVRLQAQLRCLTVSFRQRCADRAAAENVGKVPGQQFVNEIDRMVGDLLDDAA